MKKEQIYKNKTIQISDKQIIKRLIIKIKDYLQKIKILNKINNFKRYEKYKN